MGDGKGVRERGGREGEGGEGGRAGPARRRSTDGRGGGSKSRAAITINKIRVSGLSSIEDVSVRQFYCRCGNVVDYPVARVR